MLVVGGVAVVEGVVVWLVGPATPGIPRSLRSRPFHRMKGAECVLTAVVVLKVLSGLDFGSILRFSIGSLLVFEMCWNIEFY